MQQTSITAFVFAAFLALTAALVPLSQATAGEKMASGSFTGKSNHVTSGGVSIVKSGGGFQLVLEDSFKFDGAPDPKLAFGKNGYDKSTIFSKLKANSGKQVYDVPASIDLSRYNEVWVWCEKFSVPLGVAKLN